VTAETAGVRRGGGPQTGVVRHADVVRAALAVTRRSSLDLLTVRAVALELGVTSPAVYHHVAGGRQALIELVVDSVVESVEGIALAELAGGDTWLDRLERVVFTIARATRDHPGVLPYLVSTGRDRPTSMRGSDFIARQLLAGGFSKAQAAKVFDGITALVAGWALTQRQSRDAAQRGGHKDLAAILGAHRRADERDLRVCLRAMVLGMPGCVPPPARR
jgi:AcrR family transcriptional regulator